MPKGNHTPARYKGGRPVVKTTIKNGDGVILTRIVAGATAELGRGTVSVEKLGTGRLVRVAQADGSEIRILIP